MCTDVECVPNPTIGDIGEAYHCFELESQEAETFEFGNGVSWVRKHISLEWTTQAIMCVPHLSKDKNLLSTLVTILLFFIMCAPILFVAFKFIA